MRWRVASLNSETEFIRMLEWNCSRLVIRVCRVAMPIAPPRLRVMLNRPEAEPAFSASMPALATTDSGVITSAWPIARTMLAQNSWSAA